MGFFSRNKKERVSINWIPINDIELLEKIKKESNNKVQLIFKHSTRCSISSMALNRFESNFHLIADKVNAHYLDLITFREISNKIGNTFKVEHQSPQVLVIFNGTCIYNASHNGINVSEILKVL